MFKKMKLGTKLLLAFLAVGVIPVAISGIVSLTQSSQALEKAAFNQLKSTREIKKDQIERFFAEREGDMGVLMETVATLRHEANQKLEAQHDLKTEMLNDYFNRAFRDMEMFARSGDATTLYNRLVRYHDEQQTSPDGDYNVSSSEYEQIWNAYGHNVTAFQKQSGYYDVFMLCAKHGHVMYSAARESDLGQNVRTSLLRDSGLHEVWKKTIDSGQQSIVDFRPYAPSNGEPASFVGVPMYQGDELRGVMVVLLSIDQINNIMSKRAGLGKTGETYLVGPDKLMRSDAFFDKQNHSVIGSFANPDKGQIDTESVRWALAGQDKADVVLGYHGTPVLSVAAPFQILDLTWAIVAEQEIAEAYSPVDQNGTAYYAKYIEQYGYYDLFLFDTTGYAFYTVTQEADYQTNFNSGKYADSNLGQLFREVTASGRYGIADFAPYAPSGGVPAAFIAQPVMHNGETEMVVALQLSLDSINAIMQQRTGMGETGESYLVGPDKLMRSDSYLDPTNHSVTASFANPEKGKVDTAGSRAALAGTSDVGIIEDYNGNPVLSAYAPVNAGGLSWGLLAEIDQAEAMAAVNQIQWLIGIMVLIIIAAVVTVAMLITRSITRPILQGVNLTQEIAKGDFNQRMKMDRGDEIGILADALDGMADNLSRTAEVAEQIASGRLDVQVQLASEKDQLGLAFQSMVASLNDSLGQVQVASEQIASGSSQVSDSSQALSQGATESASSLEEISSSLNELASQTSTNAENASQANSLSATATESAEKGSQQMQTMVAAMAEINDASQNISKIIKTIDEIAFQTNLLALNAAVEAARAGQHGKGFAVVAEEVRNLAARSAKAAEETSQLIEGSVEKTANGSSIAQDTAEALGEIVTGISKVSDLVAEIAAASNEQAQGVSQINQGVSQIDQVTQQNTASAEESAAASEELSGQALQLQEMLKKFVLSGQASAAPAPRMAAPVTKSSGESWGNTSSQQPPQLAAKQNISLDDDEFGKF